MSSSGKPNGLRILALGALGVVFGDIGTSPLYALQLVFSPEAVHRILPSQSSVYGIISLVFWSITLVVTIKYVMFITRADNDGEGGIMALISMIRDKVPSGSKMAGLLVLLGLFGASLFYGDSVITPAISVLSAVEGLETVEASLGSLVVPITLAILICLFAMQRWGTERVGKLFGPVMLIWFSVLGILGLMKVIEHPEILSALAPYWAIQFFLDHALLGFFALSAVVLTITGAEALYADMGHFGRRPIIMAWLIIAFPALTLQYLGQGALILNAPEDIANPFFLLVPSALRLPMVFLATAATIIASQAVISGAFSVTRQAVQLGFLPRLRILHTSRSAGQIYIPAVNWLLLISVLALVIIFGSSAQLASAYGIAVTACTLIDTLLFFFVVRVLWKKPLWLAMVGSTFFLAIDLAFLSACLSKIPEGGWLPVLLGIGVFYILVTWQQGRKILTERRGQAEGDLQNFIDELHRQGKLNKRIPGTAIFLHPSETTTPLALRANVEHNQAIHQQVIILWIKTLKTPHVPAGKRVAISDLGYENDGIVHVTASFGFADQPVIPEVLEHAARRGVPLPLQPEQDSYFVSKMEIRLSDKPGMNKLSKRIFIFLSRLSADPIEYFSLPYDRAVVMGSHIDL